MSIAPPAMPGAAMSAEMASHMAAALGLPLFSTDLVMPAYAPGASGRWRLLLGGFAIDHGYSGGPCATYGMPLLQRHRDDDAHTWDTWMSLSPHEIESQELGCRHAHGHTVVMGLGMGWAALNIACNARVRRVTVVERDPEVIDLFRHCGALRALPVEIAAKVRIVKADALAWRADEPVDFLHADIWRTLAEPDTVDHVRRMQANLGAACIYFWGQELFIDALAEAPGPDGARAPGWAERCIAERIGLPLLSPPGLDYAAYIARVAAQRRARWPMGIPDVGR